MIIVQNGQHLVVTGFPTEAIPKNFSQSLSSIGSVSNVKNDSTTMSSFMLTLHKHVDVVAAKKELEEYETLYNEHDRV